MTSAKRITKNIISFILTAAVICFSAIIAEADALPSPDWVKISEAGENGVAVIIETPDGCQADYYEVTVNGGYPVIIDGDGGSVFINTNADITVKYSLNGRYSEVYSFTVKLGEDKVLTDDTTGISAAFPFDAVFPEGLSVSSSNIVGGKVYDKVESSFNTFDDFIMYELCTVTSSGIFGYDSQITWTVPLPDNFTEAYSRLYFVSDGGELTDAEYTNTAGKMTFKADSKVCICIYHDNGAHPGDVNLDGSITPLDVKAVLRGVAHLDELTDAQLLNADVTKDGRTTTADAKKILRHIAGLELLEYLENKDS